MKLKIYLLTAFLTVAAFDAHACKITPSAASAARITAVVDFYAKMNSSTTYGTIRGIDITWDNRIISVMSENLGTLSFYAEIQSDCTVAVKRL